MSKTQEKLGWARAVPPVKQGRAKSRKPRPTQTRSQRWLPKIYLGLWLTFLASLLATCSIGLSASSSYDANTAHVVTYYCKGGHGSICGFVTPTEDRIDTWASTVLVLSLMICWLGPTIAAQTGWFEPQVDKPPRLWD